MTLWARSVGLVVIGVCEVKACREVPIGCEVVSCCVLGLASGAPFTV